MLFYFTDFLPSSMTCNLDLLSDFFSSKDDESDWFLEDYNNIMIDTIKNTFDNFGKYFKVLSNYLKLFFNWAFIL